MNGIIINVAVLAVSQTIQMASLSLLGQHTYFFYFFFSNSMFGVFNEAQPCFGKMTLKWKCACCASHRLKSNVLFVSLSLASNRLVAKNQAESLFCVYHWTNLIQIDSETQRLLNAVFTRAVYNKKLQLKAVVMMLNTNEITRNLIPVAIWSYCS